MNRTYSYKNMESVVGSVGADRLEMFDSVLDSVVGFESFLYGGETRRSGENYHQ